MTKAAELANLIGNINAGGGGVNRNLVINGAMNLSQRHGTSSVQLSATEQYLTDRFFNDSGSSYDMKADAVQSTDAPSGFSNSLKLSCDGVSSLSSGSNGGISQLIEGQNCQTLAFGTSDAKAVTLSFYAKSSSQNSGHTYGIMLGAFLNGTRNIQTRSFTVTSSWQRFTMTFQPNSLVTSTGINDDNNSGMQVFFSLAGGSSDLQNYSVWTNSQSLSGFTGQDNFFDNTSNEFFLTGVQLEIGQNPTEFEHEPFERTLAKCQRYYFEPQDMLSNRYGIWQGQNSNGSNFNHTFFLPVPMRARPTALTIADAPSDASFDETSGVVSTMSEQSGRVQFTSNATSATSYYYYSITADAEL